MEQSNSSSRKFIKIEQVTDEICKEIVRLNYGVYVKVHESMLVVRSSVWNNIGFEIGNRIKDVTK